MAGPSKNSRTMSLNASKQFQLAAETRLVIPCNEGNHAYVIDVRTGKNVHASTRSDSFANAVKGNVEAGHADRLRGEFAMLAQEHPSHGWDETLTFLETAEAFTTPTEES